MEVHIKRILFKTGGSIATTIPDEVVKALELEEGIEVEFDIEKKYGIFKKVE
jgi:antitoxin component of MazEF toxin-antitoxin module